jgi:SAM-dependent methyltransferase
MNGAEFDAYATSYDEDLARGLALTGEPKGYYARRRLELLQARLGQFGIAPRSVLDFGCGIGDTGPLFREILGVESVLGIDPSGASIDRARREFGGDRIRFATTAEYLPRESFDLGFTNGVFHHIPPAERAGVLDTVRRSLAPNGRFAFWENNPWNPGTRLIMRRVAFDRDAIMMSARSARAMLRAAGFAILSVDHAFVFPKSLGWLRGLERFLAPLPLGGQYLILGRRS